MKKLRKWQTIQQECERVIIIRKGWAAQRWFILWVIQLLIGSNRKYLIFIHIDFTPMTRNVLTGFSITTTNFFFTPGFHKYETLLTLSGIFLSKIRLFFFTNSSDIYIVHTCISCKGFFLQIRKICKIYNRGNLYWCI